MATLHVDGRPYEIEPGRNLLQVCLSHGLDIPYFCWHPALGSVGACRQCAVKQFKDEHDTRGRIIMACMTPAADGQRIALDDADVKAFHAEIIEWLMVPHPHDCPVCDEGGECHLQDMTVLTGHTYRRYRFAKRTFRNQYLGPFLNHEMNRCITCYRCVRFYGDYAGGSDLHALGSKNQVYFGRHEDGVLENEFSGNLAEVCPTGVFTDKTLGRHYTRKWDLQTAPSVCVHCSLGCNTVPGERYGTLRRIHNRYNGAVNGYFLCDRGRFGYAFVNDPDRVRRPEQRGRRSDAPSTAARADALRRVAERLSGRRVIGIGSPRASLEANAVLRRLVGPENFHAGVSAAEHEMLAAIRRALTRGPARTPSLREVEDADAVLLLGEDVSDTAPRLALALRQALRRPALARAEALGLPGWKDAAVREITPAGTYAPFFVATPAPTRLDGLARAVFRAPPADCARLAFAVAEQLDARAPAVEGLTPEARALAAQIAAGLKGAKRPLIVAGTAGASVALVEAAANVAWALAWEARDGRAAALSFALPECNSLGLALMEAEGLEAALRRVEEGGADAAIILENDLYRRAARARVDAFLADLRHVIVIDHLHHETAARADVLLPAATFAEGDGTLVSAEGRAQRYFQVFVPDGGIQESWRWLRDVMRAMGRREAEDWVGLDDVLDLLGAELPALAGAARAAPDAEFRLVGQPVPRQPHRYSGRTAMFADRTVFEPPPPPDPDAPLAFSMEGYSGRPPPALLPRAWAPRWNSVQAYNKFQQEVGGALQGGDPGVRLIEPPAAPRIDYHRHIPAAFRPAANRWLALPRPHIFGSEELSVRTPALAERIPQPYIGMAPRDAADTGLAEGDTVEVRLDGEWRTLPVQLIPGLARGVLALPLLPDTDGLYGTAASAELRRHGHG